MGDGSNKEPSLSQFEGSNPEKGKKVPESEKKEEKTLTKLLEFDKMQQGN